MQPVEKVGDVFNGVFTLKSMGRCSAQKHVSKRRVYLP